MKLSKSSIVLSIIIVVLLIIIAAMFCCDFSQKNNNDIEDLIVFEAEPDSHNDTKLQNYPLAIELDKEYERRVSAANANAEITDINSEFAEKWKAETDANYQKLLSVANDDFKEALVASQAEWYVNAEKDIEEKFMYFVNVHDFGSITPICVSKYEYNLYRERAIELFVMYDNLQQIESYEH